MGALLPRACFPGHPLTLSTLKIPPNSRLRDGADIPPAESTLKSPSTRVPGKSRFRENRDVGKIAISIVESFSNLS